LSGGLGQNLVDGEPWYRELNIMNSVLNKGFKTKSSNNSTLIVSSDVFSPACCMQNFPVNGIERSSGRSLRLHAMQVLKNPNASPKGESDEEQ